MAKAIRLAIGVLIILFPVLLGWYHRTPALIPLIGLIYVPLYFLGKAGSWALFEYTPSKGQLLKAVPSTFIVQSCLVGVFYLIGVGLAAIFTDRNIEWALTQIDLIWLVAFLFIALPLTALVPFLENPKRKSSNTLNHTAAGLNSSSEDEDFYPIPRKITPETFYYGQHYSRRNYTSVALTDIVDHKGDKPIRAPKRASEAMIAAVEKSLGVRFPDTLRTLYKIQDGGSLPTYYVPKHAQARNTYEDWITAFASDYDDLKPLESLETLHTLYMYNYDPEYDDPEIKEDWIPGSEKLIILTIRTGYGTALDYRESDMPGVLLFDMNEEEPELKRFESFDSFLNACREIEYEYERADVPADVAFGTPPDPLDPDRFWEKGNAGPGVTQKNWDDASQRLGAPLPQAFLPFFAAANGGKSIFKVALQDGENKTEDPLHIFPVGPYVYAGDFLKLEHWISLADLSDRLNFVDNYTPWRDLYNEPEKLIVFSAAFDSALLLDYRDNPDAPKILAIADLDKPDKVITFPTVENFLSRLRRYGRPDIAAKNEIGDNRISARLANTDSFWIEDESRAPLNPETLSTFLSDWGLTTFGLPDALKKLYEKQNGGQIRFRFAPPQTINNFGHTQRPLSSDNWIDVFPEGWLPFEDWHNFDSWRQEQKLATEQSLFDFTDRISAISEDDENIKIRLFIIGIDNSTAAPTLTLLDMSEDFFNRNRHIMTVKYNPQTDKFDIIFGPIMSDNIFSGLYQSLRARKTAL